MTETPVVPAAALVDRRKMHELRRTEILGRDRRLTGRDDGPS